MNDSPELNPPPPDPGIEFPKRKRGGRARWAVAAVAAAVILIAMWSRPNRSVLAKSVVETPVVGAMKVRRESVAREKVFDSELRPYQEVDLHAKVAGYVESILVDIGDHVKEGQLIATLDLPETQSDLARAMASQRRSEEEIKRATASYAEAKLVLDRLMSVEKTRPNLIARAEIDAADSREKAAAAGLAEAREQEKAAEAEVTKLQTMLKYAKITAPFDGVITERYADKGALIQAGTSSSTQAMPLVRLSDNKRLRLVFPVEVSAVGSVQVGKIVEVEIPGLHKAMKAKITRSAQKVTTSTRTMNAEVDIANDDFSLIPGMYASVRMDVELRPDSLVIPVEALTRGKNPTVYLINREGIIEERAVKLGLETPEKVEALDGVTDGNFLMVGNRAAVKPGQKVMAKLIKAKTAAVTQ
jgi:RND family efflux transporter MFP subunit